MRISRKEDIALLFMTELASQNNSGYLSLSTVSKNHGISVLYLKKIALMLRSANLIISKEGFDGGYILSKSAFSISIWDIFEAVTERKLTFPKWDFQTKSCPVNQSCLPQMIRNKVDKLLISSLTSVTLNKLL